LAGAAIGDDDGVGSGGGHGEGGPAGCNCISCGILPRDGVGGSSARDSERNATGLRLGGIGLGPGGRDGNTTIRSNGHSTGGSAAIHGDGDAIVAWVQTGNLAASSNGGTS